LFWCVEYFKYTIDVYSKDCVTLRRYLYRFDWYLGRVLNRVAMVFIIKWHLEIIDYKSNVIVDVVDVGYY